MINPNEVNAEIETMPYEPYVKLENAKELEGWNKECEVAYNQQRRHKIKLDFYRDAFDFIYTHKLKGDYLEFGSHMARTFRMALTEARKKNFADMNFWAFDSFEGLPDIQTNLAHNPVYGAGGLSTSKERFFQIANEHGLFLDKIRAVEGFYETSLTNELKKEMLDAGTKISFVTLDCSFYDSFVCAFNFIEDLLQEGSMIYIDDYRVTFNGSPMKGAPKAFREFAAKSKVKYEPFLDVGWFGKSFIAYK